MYAVIDWHWNAMRCCVALTAQFGAMYSGALTYVICMYINRKTPTEDTMKIFGAARAAEKHRTELRLTSSARKGERRTASAVQRRSVGCALTLRAAATIEN